MLEFLLKLWGLTKPYRLRLFIGVAAGFVNGILWPVFIGTILFVYDVVVERQASTKIPSTIQKMPAFVQHWFVNVRTSFETGLQQHAWAVIIMISTIPLIMVLRGLSSFMNIYFLQWVGSRAIADLRVRLFRHLLDLSAGFYNQNSSGQLISRVMNDTAALQVIIGGATSVIVRDPVTLISVLAFLLWTQPTLTIIAIIALPVCLIPIRVFNKKIRRATTTMQGQSADQTQVMIESFTGYRIVKAYNLETIVTGEFDKSCRAAVSQNMRIVRAGNISGPIIEFFGSCGLALLLAYLIFGHHATGDFSTGDFLALIMCIFSMYAPIKSLNMLHQWTIQARAASERVFELLAIENSVPEPAHPKPLNAAHADIVFENLSFNYGEKPVLRNINLTVKSGRLVALVGPSGSGKTTLSNLLLRFYDPQQGAIRIGGMDIRDVSIHDLRNQIAVVTQEIILFDDTIRRNIELGRPGASNEEIIAAARHAHAYDFIMQKPRGFDTVIGEKGIMLSGGQRQRISIARAVLRNAPILVLDEATNALDTESERAVQAALDELMKEQRTTLCIAHRLSTIMHADLIVVLDQGRIVETGTHYELIQRGGVYQKLYELQFQSHGAAQPVA